MGKRVNSTMKTTVTSLAFGLGVVLCGLTVIAADEKSEAKARRLEPGVVRASEDGLLVLTENYAFEIQGETVAKKYDGEWSGQVYVEVQDGVVLIEVFDENSQNGEWVRFKLILDDEVGNDRFFLEAFDPPQGEGRATNEQPNTADCPGGSCSCSGSGGTGSACCPAGKTPVCTCLPNSSTGRCVKARGGRTA